MKWKSPFDFNFALGLKMGVDKLGFLKEEKG